MIHLLPSYTIALIVYMQWPTYLRGYNIKCVKAGCVDSQYTQICIFIRDEFLLKVNSLKKKSLKSLSAVQYGFCEATSWFTTVLWYTMCCLINFFYFSTISVAFPNPIEPRFQFFCYFSLSQKVWMYRILFVIQLYGLLPLNLLYSNLICIHSCIHYNGIHCQVIPLKRYYFVFFVILNYFMT